jgi:hydroxymethyl cephem carbamoyltransferase
VLIVGIKPGHDGAIAAVSDRKLLYSLEGEKDTFRRHSGVHPMSILSLSERIGAVPDVIAVGGWHKPGVLQLPKGAGIETGYFGADRVSERTTTFFGTKVKMFSSSHSRSHIMMGAGMAPWDDADRRAVLVWEGAEGTFYLLDERWRVLREIPVLSSPGVRYAFVYALAESSYPDHKIPAGLDESGKLMALAAFGDAANADADIRRTVDRILSEEGFGVKATFRDSAVYNAGATAQATKTAAALLTQKMFDIFARVAQAELPAGIPLYISGGCGLNCDWNMNWRELGHFSSVFVPPCTNDSGSAVGTALDALALETGDPRVEWDVYCGLDFEWDLDPDPAEWERQPLDNGKLADALAEGRVVGWVQGRWEMGPRALGNRSLLAEPFNASTRERLNQIKQREDYRPIAPCCRLEDAGKVFSANFDDPYMLYFRMVTVPILGAVTHVDGSARVQTVTREHNKALHDLLSAFAERKAVGVLCNTSLNYKGFGFINRTSDLVRYCTARGVDDFVVGQAWFSRKAQPQ